MSKWTFLTNYALVLILLAKHQSISGRMLAEQLGITERAVRKIISDLEANKYIKKIKEGRKNKYAIEKAQPLRHKINQHITIGSLLDHILNKKS